MSNNENAPNSNASATERPQAVRKARNAEPLWQALLLPIAITLAFIAAGFWLLGSEENIRFGAPLLAGAVLFFAARLFVRRASGEVGLFHWSTGYWLNNLILTVSVIGVVIVLNVVAYRHSTKYDWTNQQLYSLSPQTLQILGNLKEKVTVVAFFPFSFGQGREMQELNYFRRKVKDMLDDYQRFAPSGKLAVEWVDPFKDPMTPKKYNLSENDWGTVFFETGTKKVKVPRDKMFAKSNMFQQGLPPFKGEEAFTGGLLELTSSGAQIVYFTIGHGEKVLETDQPSGLTSLKQQMEHDRYTVKTLDLSLGNTDKIPADCNVLVIAGPTKPFNAQDIAKIKAYLTQPDKGAVVLVDTTPIPGLKELLSDYGVDWATNLVLELNPQKAMFTGNAAPIVEPLNHKVTDELVRAKSRFVFQEAVALTDLQKSPDAYDIKPLAQSSQTSMAIHDTAGLSSGKIAINEATDKRGPLNVAYAVEVKQKPSAKKEPPADPFHKHNEEEKKDEGPKTRLVVVGDSDFVTDRVLQNFPDGANADLFLNAVGWCSFSSERTATIRPKDDTAPTVTLDNAAKARVGRLAIIFYPCMVLVIGILVWLRRSRL